MFIVVSCNVLILLLLLSATVEKFERVAVPVSVDSTQEEALSVLKTLKVCFL